MDSTVSLFEGIEQYKVADGREHSCFFTGHRVLPAAYKPALLRRLKATVSYLYAKGVTDFHAGGALGFDTLAAMQIIDMRRGHPGMRLILDLPYPTQSNRWSRDEQRVYGFILSSADERRYACAGKPENADAARRYLFTRNRTMVEASLYGVAYYSGAKGGTAYTVVHAEKCGCEIINLYPELAGYAPATE